MGMWWDLVPVSGIVIGLIGLPYLCEVASHKLINGRPQLRELGNEHLRYMFYRDRQYSYRDIFSYRYNTDPRLHKGNPYKSYGLEMLKD